MKQMTDAARVLLVDDHTMLREGLRRSLVGRGYDVVGEAADGAAAVGIAAEITPDVVLMDVTMPVLDGLEATRRIIAANPDARVIILTMHVDGALARQAEQAGAFGYLVKDCSADDIVEAVESALAGIKSFPASNSADSGASLTQREIEVLQLIADGRSTTAAAQELYVSIKTVKNHLGSAYAKLDAHDRTQAVLKAARMGLVRLNNPLSN